MEPAFPPLAPEITTEALAPITVPVHIGGKDETLPSAFDVIGPYTNQLVWKASDASPQDAVRAVEAAEIAFAGWSATHPKERRKLLLKAADILWERREEIAAIWRSETGANLGMSSGFVTPATCDFIRSYAAQTTSIHGSTPPTDIDGQNALVNRVPIGVVLSVIPWNAPPVFAVRSIAAPLAAGCTTVVKASDLSPRTYYALAKCYIDAGVPAGAVNLVSCRSDMAAQVVTTMIEHPAVRKIHFTGSTAVGRKIASTAALNLKPVILELGGKNSAIVLDDANLETAAVQTILGALLGSGQTCMSTDRIIVQSKIAAQFEAVFSAILGNMCNSSNVPATLVNPAARDRVNALISEAKSKGAAVLEGAWTPEDGLEPEAHGQHEKGVFVRPVVVKDITKDMKIWSDEIFGLVVTIITVDSEAEAIEIANSTEYGLSQAVFTEDLRRGLRVAKLIETGQVHINSMTLQEGPDLPFGGVKASGWGRFNGKAGIDEFLVTKTVTWMD